MIQKRECSKDSLNLSHSCGGIWCKLHQINNMPIKKKKAILSSLPILFELFQSPAIYNQLSINEVGGAYLLAFFDVS